MGLSSSLDGFFGDDSTSGVLDSLVGAADKVTTDFGTPLQGLISPSASAPAAPSPATAAAAKAGTTPAASGTLAGLASGGASKIIAIVAGAAALLAIIFLALRRR